jgi:hypothetical protein
LQERGGLQFGISGKMSFSCERVRREFKNVDKESLRHFLDSIPMDELYAQIEFNLLVRRAQRVKALRENILANELFGNL